MHATEIQDHARKLMDAHGPRAIAEAAQTAVRLEQQDKTGEARDWRRIEAALRQMRGPRES